MHIAGFVVDPDRQWSAPDSVARDSPIFGVGEPIAEAAVLNVIWDPVDFFEVVEVTPNSLGLRAEMKVPGHAWLEWQVHRGETGRSVEQRAVFVPRGLGGRFYWLALVPAHAIIFKRMLRAIVDRAETLATTSVGGSEK